MPSIQFAKLDECLANGMKRFLVGTHHLIGTYHVDRVDDWHPLWLATVYPEGMQRGKYLAGLTSTFVNVNRGWTKWNKSGEQGNCGSVLWSLVPSRDKEEKTAPYNYQIDVPSNQLLLFRRRSDEGVHEYLALYGGVDSGSIERPKWLTEEFVLHEIGIVPPEDCTPLQEAVLDYIMAVKRCNLSLLQQVDLQPFVQALMDELDLQLWYDHNFDRLCRITILPEG